MRKENGYYDLTQNVLSKKRYKGFSHRNIVEAVIFSGIVLLIIQLIPFTTIYTLMTSIVLGSVTFYVFLKGKDGLSITQILILEFCFRRDKCVLHLRGPEYKRKGGFDINEYENKSVAEITLERAKHALHEFVDTYSQS